MTSSSPNDALTIQEQPQSSNMPALLYVVGGLSFVPLLGLIFFGPIALVVAAVMAFTLRLYRPLVILAGAGMVFNLLLYGSLFFFMTGAEFSTASIELNRMTLNSLTKEIELYKIETGQYPESVHTLQGHAAIKKSPVNIHEVNFGGKNQPKELFFKRVAGGYVLFSTGPDNIPYTDDDVFPDLSIDQQTSYGYQNPNQAVD